MCESCRGDSLGLIAKRMAAANTERPQPCPATTVAVLGLAEPTEVICRLAFGHVGPHVYRIEWT